MHSKTLLLIGASRGLGHAMAETFVHHGWQVIGTVRDITQHTPLHALAREYPQQVRIEQLDICEAAQISALSQRLSGQTRDMLFVNAGTTNRDPSQTIGEITTDDILGHIFSKFCIGK